MLKQQSRLVAGGLRLFDLAVLGAAFPVAYLIRDRLLGARFSGLYPISYYWPLLAVTLLLWMGAAWILQVYGAYRTKGLATELSRVAGAMALVAVVIAAGSFLAKRSDLSRLFVALYYAVATLLLVVNRFAIRAAARAARSRGYNTRAFAVVGTSDLATGLVETLTSHREWGLAFAGYIQEENPTELPSGARVLGRLSELGRLLDSHVIDEVIFAVPRERLEEIEAAVLLCEEQGVSSRVCLNFFPRRIARMSLEELDGVPFLGFATAPTDSLALLVKRVFDLVVSLLLLAVLSPLLLLIAVAVKLDSSGPVFFRQRRIGLNGREFTLYKFRSMHDGAETQQAALNHRNEMDGPVFKMSNDPRITRVGWLLRRTSLDEFPQFWNVLRGEMSVVGPRPPLPAEVKRYQRWQRRRLSMKPGVTCTWQVSGRNEIDFDRWIELDLHYIDNWSLWRDLKIFFKTIPAVIWGRGAR